MNKNDRLWIMAMIVILLMIINWCIDDTDISFSLVLGQLFIIIFQILYAIIGDEE